MTNGDFVNDIISDETVEKIARKIGIIHELTKKLIQVYQK